MVSDACIEIFAAQRGHILWASGKEPIMPEQAKPAQEFALTGGQISGPVLLGRRGSKCGCFADGWEISDGDAKMRSPQCLHLVYLV